MKLRELKTLVSQGENQYIEFKKKVDHPEKVIKEVVAFANSQGGNLLIGVNDDGTLSGLKFPEEEAFVLNQAISKFIRPEVDFKFDRIPISSKRSVLHYKIKKSQKRPHTIRKENGRIESFIRIKDRSVKASRELQEIFRQEKHARDIHFYFGKNEKLLMKYLDDHQSITLSEFMKLSKLSRVSASKKLVLLVLANVLKIEPDQGEDRFLVKEISQKN